MKRPSFPILFLFLLIFLVNLIVLMVVTSSISATSDLLRSLATLCDRATVFFAVLVTATDRASMETRFHQPAQGELAYRNRLQSIKLKVGILWPTHPPVKPRTVFISRMGDPGRVSLWRNSPPRAVPIQVLAS